jgi:riboflavin synthase
MFTGIVQGTARLHRIQALPGLHRLQLALPPGFDTGLAIGASVAVDGVCLTVTARHADAQQGALADFDVMQQTLAISTLGMLAEGGVVNVERAAAEGAEVGGHVLSGHVDVLARVVSVREPQNNRVLRIGVPAPWMRYVFAKGYIAVNGCSLTVAEAHKEVDGSGWFEVWLIPETLRATTFSAKGEGAALNIEIERQTQVIVDTVRDVVEQRLGELFGPLEQLKPALERLLAGPPPG